LSSLGEEPKSRHAGVPVSPIPHDKSPDSTLALLSEGYTFVSDRCRRYRSDIFETRLTLKKAVCILGEEPVKVFYEPGRFTRKGALPITTLKLLQDKGSASLLDGEAHRWRKRMFMSLMTPAAIQRLGDMMADRWRARLGTWEGIDQVVLLDEVQEILCLAVCAWSGVPLPDSEAPQRTRELAAMVSGAGAVGPRNWRGMLLRARTEGWGRDIIKRVRAGEPKAGEETAAHVIVWHRDLDGELLTPEVAAVELINVLRPTVAVACS